MKCSGCLVNLAQGEEVTKCTSSGCQQSFHSACINSVRLTIDEVSSWVCPDCCAEARKGGDNSSTPIRNTIENVTMRKKVPQQPSGPSKSDAAANENVATKKKVPQPQTQQPPGPHKSDAVANENATMRKKVSQPQPQQTSGPNKSDAAANDNAATRKKVLQLQPQHPPGPNKSDAAAAGPVSGLQSLSSEMSLLRKSATDMWDLFKGRLDELCDKIASLDGRIKSLEKLEGENTMLKAKIDDLQTQLENQAQAALRNEVEIIGLEELANENPYHLVLTTAVKLGVELSDTDLVHVTRVGPKRHGDPGSGGDEAPTRRLQRPLAVVFVRRAKRDEFLKQAKIRRNVKSKDIVVSEGPDSKVYVNERLTSRNRRLFRISREFANEYKYKHCWVHNGAIFVRKQDAKYGSPAIRIKSDYDLYRLSNSHVQCASAADQPSAEANAPSCSMQS